MQIKPLHSWDVTPEEAMRLQRELARQVIAEDFVTEPKLVAGVDVHQTDGEHMQAVVCVIRLPELIEVESARAEVPITFPYIPGLLAFREGPAVIAAFEQLETVPDVILWDAQGLAHPRRLGLASHMGLWLDIPSIGAAKSRLYGECDESALGDEVGATVPLIDRRDGSTLGVALRTRKGVHPIYVSIGHKVTLETAVHVTLSCIRKYRIPEPQRLAHNKAKQKEEQQPPADEKQGRLF